MTVDTSIFKAYDIRGVYPTQLDEDLAYKIGRAYAQFRQEETGRDDLHVAVARDMRTSSPSMRDAVVDGLLDGGLDVTDIGLASTPTFYHSVGYYKFDGGIQVSASHNPKEYNGFKLVRDKAKPISGEDGIVEIRDMVVADEFSEVAEEDRGSLTEKKDILDEMVAYQLDQWDVKLDAITPIKIVADAANSMGAPDMDVMFEGLPVEIIRKNWELDGTFPNHQPDPLDEENMRFLQEQVVKEGADLGIAPDGDGDRYFFVDNQGNTIRQEILRGIIAEKALERRPNETICYDIRPGRITRDMIVENGGEPSVTRVGHSLIKAQMIEEDAPFGGESSGHYFFKFPTGTYEAPTLMVLLFLEYLGENGVPADKTVSEVTAPFQKYHHSGEINSIIEDKDGRIQALAEKYSDAEISFLDGITVEYEDWWFNVRKSNTEPKLRLNLEAVSQEKMEEKRDEVLAFIREEE